MILLFLHLVLVVSSSSRRGWCAPLEQEGLASLVTTPLVMNSLLAWWPSCGEQEFRRLPAEGRKVTITWLLRSRSWRNHWREVGREPPGCSNPCVPVGQHFQNTVHFSGVSHSPAITPVKAEPSAHAKQRERAAKATRSSWVFSVLRNKGCTGLQKAKDCQKLALGKSLNSHPLWQTGGP